MGDFLVELGRNPQARKVVSTLGLPVKLPPELARASGPDGERPLEGARVICAGAGAAPLLKQVQAVVESAGADVTVGDKPLGLVFDATALSGPEQLRELYDFLHPRVRGLARCGRLVVLAAVPEEAENPACAAAARACHGLVRSLAKELGGKGTTVNLLQVANGGEEALAGPLRWLLSRRSAFVSGQVVTVGHAAGVPSRWTAPLEGKLAVVTGAARGIGAEIARRLAEEGARVLCVDLPSSHAELDAVAQRIGGEALGCDLGQTDAPGLVCQAIGALAGGVDVLVHNAGITRDRTLGKMNEKGWDLCVDINLAAPLRINDAIVAAGLLNEGGRIVHLASIAGVGGNPGQTNYSAAKSGLIGYVAALAPSLAGRGVTVNAIAPGFIETRMTAAIPVVTRELARRLNSLGQGGQPQDVADVITFIASPAAQGITGQTIRVCGQHLAGA